MRCPCVGPRLASTSQTRLLGIPVPPTIQCYAFASPERRTRVSLSFGQTVVPPELPARLSPLHGQESPAVLPKDQPAYPQLCAAPGCGAERPSGSGETHACITPYPAPIPRLRLLIAPEYSIRDTRTIQIEHLPHHFDFGVCRSSPAGRCPAAGTRCRDFCVCVIFLPV